MPATRATSGCRVPSVIVMQVLRGEIAANDVSHGKLPHGRKENPMPMTPRERLPYSAIVDRPLLKLPDDARVVVWTIVNLEAWDIGRPMPRTVLTPPMGQ